MLVWESEMAHEVSFEIPKRDLGKSDVEFHVKKDGEKLGTLAVSKGAVVWFPKDHTIGYKLSWSWFDTLMRERGAKGRSGGECPWRWSVTPSTRL